jgi:2-polyprenyl-3-methyl-5-hydroxy-6-metoxy-1,4-benzoquinol methylase
MINHAIQGGDAAFSGYYETPRLDLLDLLAPGAIQRALEIGCGAGANLREIKKRFPACHTTGVELRRDAAQAATRSGNVDDVIEADVLSHEQVNFAAGSFDLVICSHVLEHFAEPEKVLLRVGEWLAPGGQVLVALPNVRHLSVLLDLIWRGDFRYQPSGILDHTHLRFYTKKSASRFLSDCGWHIEACQADVEGPKSRRLSRWTLGCADDFAAFAYNFRLRAR